MRELNEVVQRKLCDFYLANHKKMIDSLCKITIRWNETDDYCLEGKQTFLKLSTGNLDD